MIYVLKESWMNRTVTMSTIVTGIEANNFTEAINIIKKLFAKHSPDLKFDYWQDDDKRLSYNSGQLLGSMDDKGLKIMGIKDVE